MYYGNSTVGSQENPTGVWDSNYLLVHHLEEAPTGTITDSTGNNEDGSTTGSMNSGDLVDAWIGSYTSTKSNYPQN